MSTLTSHSTDTDVLELLRACGPLGVVELSAEIAVTPTAVRQRLGRLLAQGLIERRAIRNGRGRPKHRYQLTQMGIRHTGSNFADLAQALWREVSNIEDFETRRTVLRRVLQSLFEQYAKQMEGRTLLERMRSLADLLAQRRLSFTVELRDQPGQLPVLTAHACPYPELAESDRTICALERVLLSELLGESVQLSLCRLDGGSSCQFQAS
jgi:DeoR family transcriptional regulator, suf operon transcriptional repressor